ncbi:MAG: bi-domain-containing oxidoreductase [Acidobacteriota bacterium]|nr:bi-domain-containing oxidoreductase [Acidobacteriota bacterium]
MKQVIQNFRSGVLKVDDVPQTICRSGGILVHNVTSLISAGTEKMTVDLAQKSLVGKAKERPDLVKQVWAKLRRDGLMATLRTVQAKLDAPLALGYSCAGLIAEVGRGAEEFSVGDRVACAGMNYASHAETVFIPKNLAVKIPDGVSFDEAAFVTLGAIALQGVRTAEVKLGDAVAVIGLGLLGQLTVQILKAAGCRVIGIDLESSKVAMAIAHGADAAVLRGDDVEAAVARFTAQSPGCQGVDAVIVTAAADTNDPIELAGAIARDRAIVTMVGAVRMDIPRKVYYEKELQLRMARSYGPGRYDAQYEERGVDYPVGYVRWTERRNMQEFLRLLATKAVKLDRLITHRFPIAQAEQAYDIITGKTPQPYLGILLIYSEAAGQHFANVINLVSSRKSADVRLGVIGAGNFAKSVLLPRLAKMSSVSLIGLATATGRTAKAVGEQFGFEACTTDYRELLANEEINTILIATRHDMHAMIAAEALRAGKTVYVEKPLAISQEEFNQVAAAIEQMQGRILVGFNRRFSPLSAELKQFFDGIGTLAITYRINAGEIPKESWIQQHEGGGRIVGEVCHFVDYLQFLTGADPVEVFAYQNASGIDTLSIVIKLSDGSIGNINYFATGDRGFPKERVEVYGGGRVSVLDDFRQLEMWRDGKRKVVKRLAQDKGFDRELAAFIEAAREGREMPIGWRSLALTTLACLRIEESLRSGRPEVVDLRFEI